MTKHDEPNNFIRTIFWALLIGSFGWTTFCFSNNKVYIDSSFKHAEEIKNEMIRRDEMIQNSLFLELRKIDSRLASIETELKIGRK